MWLTSFYAIAWTIWLHRNGMVFNGKVFDFQQTIDSSKFRAASWFKARWPDTPHSILDIVRFPNDIQVQKVSKATKRSIVWEPPSPESMKFNVEGVITVSHHDLDDHKN